MNHLPPELNATIVAVDLLTAHTTKSVQHVAASHTHLALLDIQTVSPIHPDALGSPLPDAIIKPEGMPTVPANAKAAITLRNKSGNDTILFSAKTPREIIVAMTKALQARILPSNAANPLYLRQVTIAIGMVNKPLAYRVAKLQAPLRPNPRPSTGRQPAA